jgi:glycosyltransferase involved in cell wall biosynthesis
VVSVILATYNRAHLLRESIQSVLQQEYRELELFVLDDGSEDGTAELVCSFGDSRIRYFHFPHTGHTGRLKNFGLRHAAGELIAFIDSDDTWKPGKLEKQVRLLEENPGIGFSITDVTTFRDDTILIDHTYHRQNTIECRSIFPWMKESRFIVYNPTLIIRKGCLDRTGYFSETMRSGDYNFNCRLAWHFQAGIIYETLVMRRVHETNMSRDIPFENYAEYLDTFDYLYREKIIGRRHLHKARANAYYKMGKLYAAKGDWAAALEQYRNSLKYRPLKLAPYQAIWKAWRSRQGN